VGILLVRPHKVIHKVIQVSSGVVNVTALVAYQRSYSTSSPVVSTGMGDVSAFNSRRRQFISVCNHSHAGRLSLSFFRGR